MAVPSGRRLGRNLANYSYPAAAFAVTKHFGLTELALRTIQMIYVKEV